MGQQQFDSNKKMMDVDITAAVTAVNTTAFMVSADVTAVSFVFVWDSGTSGTDITAWAQTSLDGGTTWQDVASFNGTTSDINKVAAVSSHIAHTHATVSDGALADNSILNGMIGTQWRVKYTSTGTYVGANLKVFAAFKDSK